MPEYGSEERIEHMRKLAWLYCDKHVEAGASMEVLCGRASEFRIIGQTEEAQGKTGLRIVKQRAEAMAIDAVFVPSLVHIGTRKEDIAWFYNTLQRYNAALFMLKYGEVKRPFLNVLLGGDSWRPWDLHGSIVVKTSEKMVKQYA